MSIKTILVPLSNPARARSALETACQVARRFDGHVVGVHVRPAFKAENLEAIMEMASLGRSSPLLREALDFPPHAEDEDTQIARELFEQVCRDQGVPLAGGSGPAPDGKASRAAAASAAFKVIAGEGPEAVAEQGRVFDLVVAGQPKTDPDHKMRETLRAVLFHSGRPVLSVPERTPASVGDSVLIAWNRSALSARAAAIARRYFEHAKRVGVLSVVAEERPGPAAEELVEYLAWHGVKAILVEAEPGRRRLGEVILDQADAFGADLLVMGAYSQSPFRESLTRGVTNHILSHAELPVLLTH